MECGHILPTWTVRSGIRRFQMLDPILGFEYHTASRIKPSAQSEFTLEITSLDGHYRRGKYLSFTNKPTDLPDNPNNRLNRVIGWRAGDLDASQCRAFALDGNGLPDPIVAEKCGQAIGERARIRTQMMPTVARIQDQGCGGAVVDHVGYGSSDIHHGVLSSGFGEKSRSPD